MSAERVCILTTENMGTEDDCTTHDHEETAGETMSTYLAYQHHRAPNDANGNPRRVWVVYGADGAIAAVVDEGYSSRPQWLRELPELGEVDITATEYKRLLKVGASR